MLDYKFITENIDAVKTNINNRFMKADVDAAVRLYSRRTELVTALQALQQKRNTNAASMKGKIEQDQRNLLIEEGKKLKEEIASAAAISSLSFLPSSISKFR